MGGLGSGSGPKLTVLACLGAKVVGLGSGSRPKLTVLACLGAKAVGLGRGSGRKVALARAGKRSGQEIRPKSGPNPSESRICKRSGPPRHHRPPQAIFQLIAPRLLPFRGRPAVGFGPKLEEMNPRTFPDLPICPRTLDFDQKT